MHLYGLTLGFLLPSLAFNAVAIPSALSSTPHLSPRNPSTNYLSERTDSLNSLLYIRDADEPSHAHAHGHSHGHANAAPIVQLNETEVLLYHAPTPPSYWSIDMDDHSSGETRYPTLMTLHALFMMLAFFGALPAGLFWSPPFTTTLLMVHSRNCSSFC
jgi:hypothetical protein